jgi:hypothetical protein
VFGAEPMKRTFHGEDETSVDEGGPAREAQTSSSTGGPVWTKPAYREARAARDETIAAQRTCSVTTRVTAEGVMKTVPVDPSVMSLTVGYSWMKRLAGDEGATRNRALTGAPIEVTPVAVPPLIPPAEPRVADDRRERRSEALVAELT